MKRMVPRLRSPLALFALILGISATLVAARRSDRADTPECAAPAPTAVAVTPAPAPAAPAPVAPQPSNSVPAREAIAATVIPVPLSAGAGMRVDLDPETGGIGGPIRGAIEPESVDPRNDSAEGLVVEVLPNGSQMVNLEGRFQEYYVVRMDPNGKKVVTCVRDPRMLNPLPAQPATPRFEER